MQTETLHCPNCSAPLDAPVGETDLLCEYCESRLRRTPVEGELEVVRTREEMKYKERVAVRQAILRKQLEQEEAERWRQTAANVAITVLPAVGTAVGRGLFRAALRRGIGCGCLLPILAALAAALLWFAIS